MTTTDISCGLLPADFAGGDPATLVMKVDKFTVGECKDASAAHTLDLLDSASET
jgi:hypothetical protein